MKKIEKNQDIEKIKEKEVTKKPENNKITYEELKKKENQENQENQKQIEVWKINKDKSKERKAYEDEMNEVKSNEFNSFRQYTFYFCSLNINIKINIITWNCNNSKTFHLLLLLQSWNLNLDLGDYNLKSNKLI